MSAQVGPAAMDPSVLRALRLGWSVAELRGRYREQLEHDPNSEASKFDRTGNSLPLQEERNAIELAIEVEKGVVALAAELKLEIDAEALRTSTTAAQRAKGSGEWDAAWSGLAESLYKVDAAFQDGLYAGGLAGSAAYQLGRALAEVTWELDPTAAAGPNSLSFLLGEDRITAMRRLLVRLRQNVDEVSANAIEFTLRAWQPLAQSWPASAAAAKAETDAARKAVAESTQRASVVALREQARAWHDLLLDQVPWATLVDPTAAVKRRPSLAPLKPFWPELLLGTVGVIGLGLALLVVSQKGSGAISTLVAVLSAGGIGAAGLRAMVKDQAQNLIGQMQRAFNMELAAAAILRLPMGWEAPKRAER